MQSRGLFGKKRLEICERVRDIPPPDEDHVLVKVWARDVLGSILDGTQPIIKAVMLPHGK